MSLARFWSTVKLLHLSKPAGDRPLYRATRGRTITSVLEINVGQGVRSERLVHWIRDCGHEGPIRYAAIDAFESGGPGHLTLKEFHSRLGRLGTKPFPVPTAGGLATALMRVAHTIGAVDLLVLDCDADELDQPRALSMLSRLAHEDSLVLRRDASGGLVVAALPAAQPAPSLRSAA